MIHHSVSPLVALFVPCSNPNAIIYSTLIYLTSSVISGPCPTRQSSWLAHGPCAALRALLFNDPPGGLGNPTRMYSESFPILQIEPSILYISSVEDIPHKMRVSNPKGSLIQASSVLVVMRYLLVVGIVCAAIVPWTSNI